MLTSPKELQLFRNFGAPRAQNKFFSASIRCTNRMTSLKLSTGSIVRSDPKKQARGVEITQILCENLAKELQNFRNFGAPCAERIACTRPAFAAKNIVTSLQLLVKLEVCSDPKKCAPGVEITQNLRKNFAKELQNFRNFGMPLAEKNACTRPACAAQLSQRRCSSQ